MLKGKSPARHLSAEIVAAYVDATLVDEERTRVEAHLAECSECRREVIEVSGAIHTRGRFRPWQVIAPVAAAAAVIAVVFLGPKILQSPPSPGPVLRGSDSISSQQARTGIEVISPAEGSSLSHADVQFVWRPPALDASYRFTVTAEDGEVIWSVATPDTAVAIPSSAAFQPGRTYFWYVDALLPDGRSTSTGVRQFSTVSR